MGILQSEKYAYLEHDVNVGRLPHRDELLNTLMPSVAQNIHASTVHPSFVEHAAARRFFANRSWSRTFLPCTCWLRIVCLS